MKPLKIFLFFLMLLPFSQSNALVITNTIALNNQLSVDNSFTFDMISQGYNPLTDSINFVTMSFDIKEIVEDPFEDHADMDDNIREFVIIYDRFLHYRGIFADMDTGVVSDTTSWTPQEECRYGDYVDGEEICYFKPDQDGFFYSYWAVYTDNLWMNSISLSIDVTRADLDEPSSLLLFMSLLSLLIFKTRVRFFK